MSEVETSSSRLRRGAKERHSYGGAARPRTSPSQPGRPPGPARGESESRPGPPLTASLPRPGPPARLHSSMFEEDPGIMSEAETSSTRRSARTKPGRAAPLPVVRTPSKTLERPLGLVFLVYRGETKRALLPNEITVADTVKALFVRSFGRALTMEYLDSPRVKIYIHDSSKDIFYELENLNEIKDRTILKLFETDGSGRGPSGLTQLTIPFVNFLTAGLGPAGLPPFTPTPFETADQFSAEPSYVTSALVREVKRAGAAGELPADPPAFPPGPAASSTLPRSAFSSVRGPEPEENAGRGGRSGGRTMPGRSKTLGPGFMRGPAKQSGYASSPDGGGPDLTSVRLASRFSAIPEGSYPGTLSCPDDGDS